MAISFEQRQFVIIDSFVKNNINMIKNNINMINPCRQDPIFLNFGKE